MGRFDKIEQNHSSDYNDVERIGDTHQHEKLPMKDKADSFNVRKELDTVTPDVLMNRCKNEKDGEKHLLIIFYVNKGNGKTYWHTVAMPRYYRNKKREKGAFEVIDLSKGQKKRKTFYRNRVKAVAKKIEKSSGKWMIYTGTVDKFK